jgi:SAM-dependent methyltransferase
MCAVNFYDDSLRAAAYESVGVEGTYAIAFRELALILARLPRREAALDFGCGAGRSSRFLRSAGYTVVGVDIAQEMVARARRSDPGGDYRVLSGDEALDRFESAMFSLVLVAWTFDNVHEESEKRRILTGLRRVLADDGTMILIASAPEIYTNEWTSFTTAPYPENQSARSGDLVKIRIKDSEDARPYEDTYFTDADYRRVFGECRLELRVTQRPLGFAGEPWTWVSEETIAPWVIYELSKPHGLQSRSVSQR